MINEFRAAGIILPLCILLTVGLLYFVLKMPKDLGIYLGWLPSLVFLILTIRLDIYYLIPLVMTLIVYIIGTVLRIDRNKKAKDNLEKKLKEIDKMSINDL